MRHRTDSKTTNRTSAQLKSLIKNLLNDLVLHESIVTTKTKAKLTSRVFDRIISKAKWTNKMIAIRYLMKYLRKPASMKVLDDLVNRYKDRTSWLTRIVRLDNRKWDAAELVQFQLV